MAQPVHPRGRGEHGSGRCLRQLGRFIPAGAGNTRRPCCGDRLAAGSSPRARGTLGYPASGHRYAVHPRGRGEHAAPSRSGTAADGSSPRARGTPHARDPAYVRRFIPAGAGNTARPAVCASSVHPRGRGEHSLADRRRRAVGSSPRARGTLDARDRCLDRRFIPAGAGNALRARHPDSAAGSSPRARGTRRRALRWRSPVHPRGRGERAPGSVAPPSNAVHPRGRGEHARSRRWPTTPVHPRGRGERHLAGPARHQPVHPRGRGEHRSGAAASCAAGSSPRARGTPRPAATVGRRFIPAGAGNAGMNGEDDTASGSSPRARGTRLG